MGTDIEDASLGTHHHLSQEMAESLTKTGNAWALQKQLDSLVGVALQNQRALGLFTASVGGTGLYLKKECCF